MSHITKESWELISDELIYIIDSNRGEDEEYIKHELEMYLTAEGIIEVIED